ncbi:Thioesterase/thiol ester dehydrase-isomerase [Punctularia strigosozonata HHB-11173 SS5]|uniref:Thioesterase/thiol ester dehydrase-isomerase n=1 Tax=Punctularia strigosozonata (strain HHB-11173) TaxID=741275 RepID=UPI0004417E2A|nr:Thioesterase/thiol ester dehydrase-isomerase [Punctularia strigosozonata HHB-11173 SS5]EIN05854.1 Thioesterase/thiol ester dehydrase-isomerase [Punctularia strigosozonata HHB-11173 SS5]
MHASYTDLILPFASEPDLLDRYTNASGGIRTGKLLEHLDSLAGSISYKHVLGPGVTYDVRRSGFYIVTAAVDRLDMLAPLNPVRDLRLSGQVIYTGKSSMEVAVKMEALPMHGQEGGEEKTLMVGRFSMVCRDARTHKARAIPGLKLETPEDEALHAIGEAHKSRRQSLAQRSLERVPPTSEEAADLHAFYLKYGNGDFHPGNGEERVWMGDTTIEKCLLMFPQERNIHQKIFGGYLMRLAYELGFANARLFTRAPVRFLSLDKIAFAAPVPIGSILRLRSRVLYSESSERWPALVHIGVQANVVEPETGSETTTNDFRFTWCRDAGPPLTRKVVPQTYKDAMLWLEAKRNLEIGDELRGLRTD